MAAKYIVNMLVMVEASSLEAAIEYADNQLVPQVYAEGSQVADVSVEDVFES